MRNLLLGLMIAVSSLACTTPAEAQQYVGCSFSGGFQMMASYIPTVVGSCTDYPTATATGDVWQHTTRGLLVWTKSIGSVAFTDGAYTWLLGPCGLQWRTN